MKFATSTSASAAVFLLAMIPFAQAFWRMECKSRTGLARIDPLVSFGTLSEHAHAVHGGSGFSETATYADMVASDCTSCTVAQDKSAYWTPGLYFEHADTGEFELVGQQGGMLAYYLVNDGTGRPEPDREVTAFPAGFQMIAGDTYLRNFSYPVPDVEKSLWTGEFATEAFRRQAAVGFNCLHYHQDPPEPSLMRHTMPEKAFLDAHCTDGIRAELMFPSCWNGKDVNTTNHKDHVRYPNLVMDGVCPDGFPVRLQSLFYETIWRTQDFIGKAGKFIWSNGDPTGAGYHGDFIMGWDADFLKDAAASCRNPDGLIGSCAAFTLQSDEVSDACKFTEPKSLVSEKVFNGLSSLPGNVAVNDGPGYAKGAAVAAAEPIVAPIASPEVKPAAPAPVAPAAPVEPTPAPEPSAPGAVFVLAASSSSPPPPPAPTSTSTSPIILAPAPTEAPAPIAAAQEPIDVFSTEFRTTGLTVEEILWVEDLVTVTIPYTSTASAPASRKKRHIHRHAPGSI